MVGYTREQLLDKVNRQTITISSTMVVQGMPLSPVPVGKTRYIFAIDYKETANQAVTVIISDSTTQAGMENPIEQQGLVGNGYVPKLQDTDSPLFAINSGRYFNIQLSNDDATVIINVSWYDL